MRSLLLAAVVAFGIAGLTAGCGSSSPSSAPAKDGAANPGKEGPLDSGTKPAKGRIPKAP